MTHMPALEVPPVMEADRIIGRLTTAGDPQQLTGAEVATLLGVSGTSLGYYNVLDHGLVADAGVTDNRTALNTLITTVIAAGGGTIYFPAGHYHFGLGPPTTATVVLSNQGEIKLRLLGDGRASLLTWGGDAAGADNHFFQIKDGTRHFEVDNLRIVQRDLTNPDSAEQHFFFHLSTRTNGNIENVRIRNCHFGVVKGDVLNCTGGLTQTACKSGVEATGSTTIAGPFTSPSRPQRVTVTYPAAWDGGGFTIAGTDVSGFSITDTIPAGIADSYVGTKEFATITSVTRGLTGVTANTATIGFAYMVQDVWFEGNYCNGFEYSGTNPNYGYRAVVVAQRLTRHINILRNYMTGSSDQLIDFEPTGNGDLGPWRIEGNILITASPNSGAQPPSPVVTLYGNGNASAGGSLLNEGSTFARNYVYGRIIGGKMGRCKISENVILVDDGTISADGGISLTEVLDDTDILDNVITTKPGFIGIPLKIESGSGYYPKSIRVRGNTIQWHTGGGIVIYDTDDVSVIENRLVYLAATTNTDDAIIVSSSAENVNRALIANNSVEGDRGGGSVRWGINFAPGSSGGGTSIIIMGNRGTGVASKGVSIPAGTYGTPPVVIGNSFPGASAPLSLGAATPVAVGGNDGSTRLFTGSGTPESVVTAPIGSIYMRTDGGAATSMYVKESGTSNTGWVGK